MPGELLWREGEDPLPGSAVARALLECRPPLRALTEIRTRDLILTTDALYR